MESASTYEHEPLSSPDSIRVFDLLPAIWSNAPVEVKLREVSLSDIQTEYEALSYVWGEAEEGQHIICAGRRLPVTDNCYSALLQLRRKRQPRTLWVDSICIDQAVNDTSTRERTNQVQRMGQVYNSATRVIIWLGSRDWEVKALFKFLTIWRFTARFPFYHDWTRKIDSEVEPLRGTLFQTAIRRMLNTFHGHITGGAHWGFYHIHRNPWFQRIWTVQEVAMARTATIMMGSQKLKWETFANGLMAERSSLSNFLRSIPWNMYDSFLASIKFRLGASQLAHSGVEPPGKSLVGGVRKATFEDHSAMLRCLCFLQCTRDHDMVYGLQAILKTWGYTLAAPNYERPVSEVFQELVMDFIRLHRSLLPLTTSIPPRPSTGLPSWVPGWSMPHDMDSIQSDDGTFNGLTDLCVSYMGERLNPYQARNKAENIAKWDSFRGTLQVRGKYIGKVQPFMWDGPRDRKDHYRQWCRTLDVPATNQYIRLSPQAKYPERLFGYPSPIDYFIPGGAVTDEWEFMGWFLLMRYWNVDDGMDVLKYMALPEGPDYMRFVRKYLGESQVYDPYSKVWYNVRYYYRYPLITLDNGLYARAHCTCQAEDEVWLLAGSDVPILLRRQKGKNGEFRVVVPAYVHGIMLGEMWPDDTSTLETITLV